MAANLAARLHQILSGQHGSGAARRHFGATRDASVPERTIPKAARSRANAARMSERIIFVCEGCGTPGVTREAWAAWDVATQAWVLAEMFDYAFCHRCHRRAQLEQRKAEGE